MTSSIVTASVVSSPRTAMPRLSPISSTSTPQLSKILAKGKSYAVSIVIWRARLFMRARSGTRTFSSIIFTFTRFSCFNKSMGCRAPTPAASEQSRIDESSNHSESRSCSRIQARADHEPNCLLNTVSPEKLTDQFNDIEKASGRVKENLQLVACRVLAVTGSVTETFAVAHDAQVNDLARLKVAHAVLEVEKVRHAR